VLVEVSTLVRVVSIHELTVPTARHANQGGIAAVGRLVLVSFLVTLGSTITVVVSNAFLVKTDFTKVVLVPLTVSSVLKVALVLSHYQVEVRLRSFYAKLVFIVYQAV
jgi:hypothetical protein